MIISAGTVWAYQLETQAHMPKVDDTLLGALAVSIHQTRRQIQFTPTNWRSGGLVAIEMLLLSLKTWLPNLAKGWLALVCTILPFLIVLTVLYFGVRRPSRWVLQNRLQPRLEKLEKLRAELSNEPEASQRADPPSYRPF